MEIYYGCFDNLYDNTIYIDLHHVDHNFCSDQILP